MSVYWNRALFLGTLLATACNGGVASFQAGTDGGLVPPGSNVEACDGVDNNRNTLVDEGCACTDGQTQACSFAPDGQRKKGICADGIQTCGATSQEFAVWGPCEGAFYPAPEVPDNCTDEDCDGVATGCPHPCVEFEVCGNGIDDDCNGKTDCEDTVACNCGAGDNGNGSGPSDDGSSDDGDDWPFPFPPIPDFPDGWGENNDCTDRCVPGASRYCDEPLYCNWGTQTCAPDGSWGACTEIPIPMVCADPFDPFGTMTSGQYDPACCVAQGLCCQNFGYDPTRGIQESVGNCTGIVTERVCP